MARLATSMLRSRALTLLTWTLMLVTLPTALYFIHVVDQRAEVRAYNHRTLSKAAETTRRIVDNARDTLESLARDLSFVCEFPRRQPYLEWVDAPPSECSDGDGVRIASDGAVSEPPQVKLGLNGGRVQLWLIRSAYEYKFNLRLQSILAEIPFGTALDLLLIADANGNVIEQHRPEGGNAAALQIETLDALRSIDTPGFEALSGASSIHQVRWSGQGYEMLCQPLAVGAVADLPSAAQRDEAQAAGDRPVGDDAGTSWVLCGLTSSQRGLMQSLQVAPFLAFLFFAFIVFALLSWPLLKLLWMSERDRVRFGDVWCLLFGTMGGLMLATILTAGYGSYRVLAKASERDLEDTAARLAANMESEISALTEWLARVDAALYEPRDDDQNLPHLSAVDVSKWSDIANLYAASPTVGASISDPSFSNVVSAWNEIGPADSHFEIAFWAGCDGEQVLKATSAQQNTPRIPLAQREYFRAARDNRLWPGSYPGRYVEPVRSLTTGRFATIIGLRSGAGAVAPASPLSGSCQPGSMALAAVQAKLVSTWRPVLPPGMQFAIVDDTGTALFHSDERRALFENAFEELGDGDRLRAIVQARDKQHLKTSYLGRPHRVYSMPLSEAPWSVVVLSDMELVSTVNLEIIGHASVLVIGYVLLLILVSLILLLFNGRRVPKWFWPGAHCGAVVTWASAIPLLSLIAFVVVAFAGAEQPDVLLLAAFLIPLLTIGALYATTESKHHSVAPISHGPASIRSSVRSCLLAWVVTAIVPAAIFFYVAMDAENRVLVRFENERLATALAGRTCAILEYYRDIDLQGVCGAPSDADQLPATCPIERRLQWRHARDLYPSTMFWPRDAKGDAAHRVWARPLEERIKSTGEPDEVDEPAAPSSPATRSTRWDGRTLSVAVWDHLARFKPIYNETTVGTRYLIGDISSTGVARRIGSWSFGEGGADFTAAPLPCGTAVKLASSFPLRTTRILGEWTVWAFGSLIGLGLFCWTRYGARRIFFGDVTAPELIDRTELEERLKATNPESGDRVLAIAVAPEDRCGLLLRPTRRNREGQRGAYLRLDMAPFNGGSEARASLLVELEQRLRGHENILLVSAVNPYDRLLDGRIDGPPTSDSRASSEVSESIAGDSAWRRVLSSFRVVTVAMNEEPPRASWSAPWLRGLDKPASAEWVAEEFEAMPGLRNLDPELEAALSSTAARRHADPGDAEITCRMALDRILAVALPSYTALWDACSEEEKLVLVQMATENVVNPKQHATVHRLLQRRLLVRDPALRPMSRSFALFITRVQDPAEVRDWERHTQSFSWKQTRLALVGLLILGLLFLWATQRALFDASLLFFSAAGLGLPGVIRLIMGMGKPQ